MIGDYTIYARRCGNCMNFDRLSMKFRSSNHCKCRYDGRRHWAGDTACTGYCGYPESRVMAENRAERRHRR